MAGDDISPCTTIVIHDTDNLNGIDNINIADTRIFNNELFEDDKDQQYIKPNEISCEGEPQAYNNINQNLHVRKNQHIKFNENNSKSEIIPEIKREESICIVGLNKSLAKISTTSSILEILTMNNEIPERKHMKYMNYVTIIVIILSIALVTYLLTIRILYIINNKIWFASFTLLLIIFGVVFFSFALKTIVGCLFIMIISPLKSLYANSTYFSAIKTPYIDLPSINLPPVIIHMPVYKEDLDMVIKPSVLNVLKAIEFYKSKGGICKYLIFDDGLQLLDVTEKRKRVKFYKKYNIGFIARPPENRNGLFKKASNMNYGISICVEINNIISNNSDIRLKEAIQIVYEDKQNVILGGNLTIPDDSIILLIDADTRIPEDCIFDTISEFIESPDLPYTQHFTNPFDEQSSNYWECLISYFTKKIYFNGIGFSTALGDSAPLVGHNAFIRWKSLNEVKISEKIFWSEETVSEDFDLFIRLACTNKFGRYITYTGNEFQEGISLSYIDEVIKMKKFTFGACEMCFNPFKYWFTKGPLNKLLLNYLKAKYISWYQKINLCIYMSTYFAMAASFYYVIFEGISSIFFPDFYTKYMVRSFDIMLTCVVIFGCVCVFGEIILQWRLNGLKNISIFVIAWNEVKWTIPLGLYFNSILFHMTETSIRYFIGLNAEWGSTVKNLEHLNSIQAFVQTIKCYKFEYIFMATIFSGYLFCTIWFNLGFYLSWSVLSFTGVHMLGPIIFNPYIMTMSY